MGLVSGVGRGDDGCGGCAEEEEEGEDMLRREPIERERGRRLAREFRLEVEVDTPEFDPVGISGIVADEGRGGGGGEVVLGVVVVGVKVLVDLDVLRLMGELVVLEVVEVKRRVSALLLLLLSGEKPEHEESEEDMEKADREVEEEEAKEGHERDDVRSGSWARPSSPPPPKTSSGGTFSPRVRTSLAILRRRATAGGVIVKSGE